MRGLLRFGLLLLIVCAALAAVVEALAYAEWSLHTLSWRNVEQAADDAPAHQVVGLPKTADWSSDRPRTFTQAPALRRQVERGELPPVAERLPEQPVMITPPEQAGPYGGTWRRLATSIGDLIASQDGVGGASLVQCTPDYQDVRPALAIDWKISDDARQFTFHLRRGVRWSDGEPFDANDIVFWHRHVLSNPHLTATSTGAFSQGEQLVALDKLDQYTVRFTFPESNPLFINRLATATNSQVVAYPRHYLKDFHGDLADTEALSRRAHEAGFNFWYDLFEDKAHGRNPELPRLTPWVMTQPPPATPIIFERNPYYWKVDPDGRQLPYIDRVTYQIVSKGLINLKIISGEVDMQTRHVDLRHYPLLMENRAAGGYRVRRWHASSNGSVLMPNMNHKDPVLAELFQDRRVRRALSHAIDREAINELIYFGLGAPAQMAPHPASPYARPEYATRHIAYDPALANRLLDAAGLAARNGRGIRLRPDGRPLSLSLESFDLIADPETMQMVARNWRAVGIDARMRQFARSLFYTRVEARMHDVAVGGNDSMMLPEQDEGYLLPANLASRHAPDWADWYRTRGDAGEVPPPTMRRTMDTHRRMRTTQDHGQRAALLHTILSDNAKQLWSIGLVSDLPAPVIVNHRFRNVPTESVFHGGLAPTQPACYAIEAQ